MTSLASFMPLLLPDGFVDLRAIRPGRPASTQRIPAADLPAIERFAAAHADANIYFGVATRATASSGTLENCRALGALFVDIDFKGYTGGEDEARGRLRSLAIPPSIVVATGGGLHAYWVLDEPIDLRSSGAPRAKHLLRALAQAVGGDLQAAEPARVLRLPGTRNVKYSPPRDVEIEILAAERRYRLADLDAALPETGDESAASGEARGRGDVPQTIGEGGRNDALFREASALRHRGYEEEEIRAALTALNGRAQPPLPDEEIAGIAKSAARYRPAPDDVPLTESGDAELFATIHGSRLRFDHRRGLWFELNPHGIWTPDGVKGVGDLALAVMRERQRRATEVEDSDRRKAAVQWGLRGESRQRLTNVLQLAATKAPIRDAGDSFDLNPWLLGCANGVVDLRTGELRPGRPEELVSLSTGVAFDSTARSERWERTLKAIFPHDGLVAFVQRALGYSITGDVRLDKWFLGHGSGRNGKGVVYGAVRAALGDYALELPGSVFDARRGNEYDLAKLPGRRFVTSAEAGNTIRLNHDLIKKLAGGDPQRAADKYERSFEFQPQCKLWFAANHKPKVADDSAGFWARVIVVPFTISFVGREDVGLRPALTDRRGPHAQAVLAWLVRGAVQIAEDGLGDMPDVVRKATDAYRDESGPIADFLAAECVVGGGARASGQELRARYLNWCSENHVRYPLAANQLGEALKARFEKRRTGCGAEYQGVGLLDVDHARRLEECA